MYKQSKREKPPAIIPPAVVDPNQRYSLPESFAILRYSPAQGYKEIASGTLRVLREGRRTYVHGTELVRRASAAA